MAFKFKDNNTRFDDGIIIRPPQRNSPCASSDTDQRPKGWSQRHCLRGAGDIPQAPCIAFTFTVLVRDIACGELVIFDFTLGTVFVQFITHTAW